MSLNRRLGWLSSWILGLRQGWSPERAASRHRPSQRKLAVEPLENRALLAVDANLAAITGIVATDLTGNGVTNDDPRSVGATVMLYQDTGNGALGSEDTLLQTGTTDGNGRYRFNNLAAGTYFVKHTAPAGMMQKPGADVVKIVVSPLQAKGVNGPMIDTFDGANQAIEAASNTMTTKNSSAAAAEAIGGERDLSAQLTSSFGAVGISANAYNQQVLEFSASATGAGKRTITWDGADNSSNLNATGLGGTDLTNGGTNLGIRLTIGADLPGGIIVLRVYTDANNWSEAQQAIPQTGGANTAEINFHFSDFVAKAGAGAQFNQVGAIQLEITGAGGFDGQLDQVTAYGPTVLSHDFADYVPLSLGDRVWNDFDNDGLLNNGEQGIGNVALNLYADTDNSGTLTNADALLANTTTNSSGNYLFGNLFPGKYIVQIAPNNFTGGGALVGYQSSTGNLPTPNPDNNVNGDDNGDPVEGKGIASAVMTLAINSEPTNDGDTNANTNLTLDFGVFTPQVDVAITKSVVEAIATPGGLLHYTLIVTNNGPQGATGVNVVDTLPAGTTFVSATSSQGTVTGSGTTSTASLGSLAKGASATISMIVSVAGGVSGTLTNNADVTAIEKEITLANNHASVTTPVQARIDLAITKTASPTSTTPGSGVTYSLTIVNNGPTKGTGVMVTDQLPAGVTYVSAVPSGGSVLSVVNGRIIIYMGEFAVGQVKSILINATIDLTTTGTVINTAHVQGNEPETNLNNNDDSAPVTVLPPPPKAANASIGGFVYVDANNNGIMDAGETPISDVAISLSGVDNLGAPVSRTTTTNAQGAYQFNGLEAGIYHVLESQPTAYNDGLDALGSHGGTLGNDLFTNISLPDSAIATDYNFGELNRSTTKKRYLN